MRHPAVPTTGAGPLPALITDDSGQRYIYYGSYFGGISARQLSADGLHSDPATQVQITIANRYEGGYW